MHICIIYIYYIYAHTHTCNHTYKCVSMRRSMYAYACIYAYA